MWRKRKTPYAMFIILFLLCCAIGYYISGIFIEPGLNILNLEQRLGNIFASPFVNYWNDKSLPCILVGLLCWMYFVSQYLYRNRNFQFGTEEGSSEWAEPKAVTKALADKKTENNMILSKNVQISKDALSNRNAIYIGAPGTGKTTGVVIPNILTASASYVMLDVKGDLLDGYGNYLKEQGMQVKSLNLKEPEKSSQFNPFRYIKTDEDLIKLEANIHANTTPPDALKGDPFWDDGVALYLLSLFYYVWLECPYKEQTMNKVLELCNKEVEVLDEDGTTALSVMMEYLTMGKRGKNHPAYVKYQKLKKGAPDTVRSIILMVNAKLKFFETPGVQRIFGDDELNLEELGAGKNWDGKTKTALFLVIPDNDRSFDFVLGMVYSQMFDTLIRTADLHFHGPLPVPVEVWMDEFANGARPDKFENLITTLRSRNISAKIFLQSVDQIKTIYKNDTWGIIMDACSVFVFLGAGRGSLSTHEYISKLLGPATIDKRTEGDRRGKYGDSSLNFDRKARDLLNPSEVARLPRRKCIILLEGYQPIIDDKLRPFSQENFRHAKTLGHYESPVVVRQLPSGEYKTIKSPGEMIPLNEESVAYYKTLAGEGKARIFEIDDDSLMEMDFEKESFDLEEAARIIQRRNDNQLKQEEAPEESGDTEKVSGSLLELIKNTPMSDEQFAEIMGGLDDGLTEEQILQYFYMEPDKMRQMRRYFNLKKKMEA